MPLPEAARLMGFIATVVWRLLVFKATTKLGRGKLQSGKLKLVN